MSAPWRVVLVHLVTTTVVQGWTVGEIEPVDVFEPNPNLVRWSMGGNASYLDGLKGGISWAIDPALCDALVPLFPEEWRPRQGWFGIWQYLYPSLLRCEHLKNSIRMAMRSWEAANSNVHFFEVTSLCDGRWETPASQFPPGSPPPASPPFINPSMPPSPPPQPPATPPQPPCAPPMPPLYPGLESPFRNVTAGPAFEFLPMSEGASTPCDNASLSCIHCPYAELIISGFNLEALSSYNESVIIASRLGHQNAARSPLTLHPREINTPVVDAADYPKGEWLRGDYTTGEWVGGFAPTAEADGMGIHSAVIELDINPERCWWYDDDICNLFFLWQSTTKIDVYFFTLSLLNILFFVGFGFTIFLVLQRLYVIFQLTALAWDTDGDGVVEFSEVKQAIKVIFGGWILKMRAKWRARFGKGR